MRRSLHKCLTNYIDSDIISNNKKCKLHKHQITQFGRATTAEDCMLCTTDLDQDDGRTNLLYETE